MANLRLDSSPALKQKFKLSGKEGSLGSETVQHYSDVEEQDKNSKLSSQQEQVSHQPNWRTCSESKLWKGGKVCLYKKNSCAYAAKLSELKVGKLNSEAPTRCENT